MFSILSCDTKPPLDSQNSHTDGIVVGIGKFSLQH